MTRQINLVGLNRPRGGRFGDCKPGHLACATFGARQGDSAVATLHFGPGDSPCTRCFLTRSACSWREQKTSSRSMAAPRLRRTGSAAEGRRIVDHGLAPGGPVAGGAWHTGGVVCV
jgi:hypothetical protein